MKHTITIERIEKIEEEIRAIAERIAQLEVCLKLLHDLIGPSKVDTDEEDNYWERMTDKP